MNERRDDLREIIDKALEGMAAEAGGGFDPQACNLADLCRRTGLTRSRARTIKGHGFRVLPHGNTGRKAGTTVPAGHTGLVDDLLGRGGPQSRRPRLAIMRPAAATAAKAWSGALASPL